MEIDRLDTVVYPVVYVNTRSGSALLISVVVPVFDEEQIIRACLDAVLDLHEVIVVDNGSGDGTLAVLGEYAGRVTLLHEPRRGVHHARNRGLDAAGVEQHVPVFPIAVRGTRRALPRKGLILREHIRARVEVLPPLTPADFPDVYALREAARGAIASALAEP